MCAWWKEVDRTAKVIHQAEILPMLLSVLTWAAQLEGRRVLGFVENSGKALEAMEKRNEVKQNESKHMMVQERRHSDTDSIAMVDVD